MLCRISNLNATFPKQIIKTMMFFTKNSLSNVPNLIVKDKNEIEPPIKLHDVDPSYDALYEAKKDKTTNKFYYQNLTLALLTDSDEPRLEELFEAPPFNASTIMSLSRQKLASLKEFKIPVGEDQIENALANEFRDPPFKTNWDQFSPLNPSEAEAVKLVSQKFLWEQLQEATRPPTSNIPYAEFPRTQITSEKILEECQTVETEMNTGDYSRHQPVVNNHITKGKTYSQEATSVLTFAAKTLGRNPTLHPSMKAKTLSIIADLVASPSK